VRETPSTGYASTQCSPMYNDLLYWLAVVSASGAFVLLVALFRRLWKPQRKRFCSSSSLERMGPWPTTPFLVVLRAGPHVGDRSPQRRARDSKSRPPAV
jgi:hypothetical protein